MESIRKSSFCFFLITFAINSASCTHRAAESRNAAPSSQPVAQLESKPQTPDVAFYSLSRRHPQSLKEDEKRFIIERARETDTKRDIWFITSGSDWRYRVQVYFLPDEIRGRARRGKALAFRYPTIFHAYQHAESRDLNIDVFDYVQVGEEPPEKFQLRPQNLPFAVPEGLTLDEVAEIMTRVQSNEELDASYPRRVEHQYPVMRFERNGEDVKIRTGFQEGGLNGGGEIIHFKRENGKWVMKAIGMWVS